MDKPNRFNPLTLLALAVIIVAIVACGTDTASQDDASTGGEAQAGSDLSETGTTPGDDTPAEGGTAGETPAMPPGFDGGLADLLRVIPLAEETRAIVWYNHYVRARDANGIEPPAEGASDADLVKYVQDLSSVGVAPGPWISGYTQHAAAQLEHRQYMGFDIGDMEQSILAGEPPNELEVATGRMDPGETDRALTACTACPAPEIQEHLGVKFYSWGDDYTYDLEKSLQPPAYDAIGRGGRIAVLDSIVLRTVATESMWSLIGTYRDSRDSLADDPDLTLAAGEMERLGAYSAILMGDVERFGPDCDYCDPAVQLVLQAAAQHSLDEYDALGTGIGHDAEGFFTILVFVYADEDAASRNVETLEERMGGYSVATAQPWNEIFPQHAVWNDGRALIARLRTEAPLIWLRIVYDTESLLWHK